METEDHPPHGITPPDELSDFCKILSVLPEVAIIHRSGKIIFANKVSLEITGYTDEELKGTHIFDYIPDDQKPRVMEAMAKRRDGSGKIPDYELRIRSKSGEIKHGLVKSDTLRIGTEDYTVVIISDITREKREIEKISQSEQRYKSIVEGTFDGIVFYRDGIILESNHVAARFAGLEPDGMRGKKILDLIHPDDRKRMAASIGKRMPDDATLHFEEMITTVNNSTYYFEIFVSNLSGDADTPRMSQAVIRDITERKKSEQEIFIHERIFHAISLASEKLLAGKQPGDSIGQALGIIGRTIGCDRVYIFRNFHQPDSGELVMSQQHEWVREGIQPQIDNPMLRSLSYLPDFRNLHTTLSSGYSYSGIVSNMPSPDREILASQNILSVLIQPINVSGTFWGFVGYDDCTTERLWTDHEIHALNTLSNILGNYFLRMEFEEKLSDSIGFNREIIENIGEGLVVYDMELRYKVWNKYMERLTGFTASEVLGKECFEVFPRLIELGVVEMLRGVLKGNNIPQHQREFYFDRFSRKGFVSASYCPHYNSDGNIIGILASIRDITDEVSNLQRIRSSEQHFQALIENSADIISILDEKGIKKFVSPSSLKILGYAPEEMMGTDSAGYFHPDEKEYLGNLLLSLIENPELVIRTEFRFRHKDGHWLHMEGSAQNLLLDENIHGIVINYRDITARKNAEAALRESTELFRSFFELSSVGFAVSNPQGQWIHFNDRFCQMLGYSSQEMARLTWMDITPADQLETENKQFASFLDNKLTNAEFEKDYLRKDGTRISVNLNTRCVRDEGGKVAYFTSIIQDISEKKAAKRALEESELKYRTIVNNSHDAIYIYRNDRILFANEIAFRLTEYPPEELYGKSMWDFLHPDDLPMVKKIAEERFSEPGTISSYSARIITRTGKIKTAEFSVQLINYQGEPAALGSARDITDLMVKQEELRRIEHLFKLITENSTDVIWTTDLDLNITYQSPSNVTLSGYKQEESLKLRPEEIYTPDSLRAALSVFGEELGRIGVQGDQMPKSRKLELEEIRKDGTIVPVEINMSFIYDGDGKPGGILGITRDISERKNAELSRKQEEERIRALYKLTQKAGEEEPVLIQYIIDEAVKITGSKIGYINFVVGDEVRLSEFIWSASVMDQCRAKSQESYPRSDAGVWSDCLKTLEPCIHNDYPNLPAKKGLPEGHCPISKHLSIPVTDTDGKIVMIAGVANKSVDYNEIDVMHLTIMMNDLWKILRRKRAEKELLDLNAELEKRVSERTIELEAINKELEAFSFSISHDLRAPLRGIVGFSQALQEDYGDVLSGEGTRYLERLIAGTKKLGELIDDLLNLSRVTRSPVKRTKVNLSEMVKQICDKLSALQPGRDVDVTIEPGVEAFADSNLIQLTLENLLDNAFKYTGKNQKAAISFGILPQSQPPEYFISDNGAGFDMAYADKLFVPFQRLHLPAEFEGTGIGLATVKRIVSKHGGHIRAKGAIDQGASFYFTLNP